ncbi:MAG: hypothetical protein ACRDPC_20465 [Solirubrobacteraceae bacterium]
MRRLICLLLVAVAVPAAPALAGGWATVELGSAPGGLSTDKPWRVELMVKAHGVTPMDGLAPRVRIRNDEGVVRTFPARPAGRTGTYVAEIRFPSAGTWRTRIFDGYTDAIPHRIAPLTVAPAGEVGPPAKVAPVDEGTRVNEVAPPATVISDDGGLPWPQITAIAALVALWLGAMAAVGGTFRLDVARGRRRTASRALAGGPPAGP